MKVQRSPCRDGTHDFFPDYYAHSGCSTPYCSGANESHCRKCGWYIAKCPCGCESGMGKIGIRQERARQRRRKAKLIPAPPEA